MKWKNRTGGFSLPIFFSKFAILEAQKLLLALKLGLDVDGTSPKFAAISQGFARPPAIQVHSLVFVPQKQLAFVPKIAVLYVNERLTLIGEHEKQLFFHLFEISLGDFVLIGAAVEFVSV